MPSLTDVANQIEATLTQIQSNTQDTSATALLIHGDTDQMKASLTTLIANNQADFANLSTGLSVIVAQQQIGNDLLDFERRQNDTIICWLTTIADLLCRQLNRLNTQIELEIRMAHALEQIKETLELVHGSQTVAVLRRHELEERLEECCPRRQPEPERCFDPCESPVFKPSRPPLPEWQPLPIPQKST
ncbi:MAG TPA: hypothetical protein VOA80_23160 [Thermoanaerobaculia bacterium]|nr:hypothetical protein [Thermoanaerobaculia bacterium]